MTRFAADRRPRSQRRILAAGIRIRGQWRYLVRSTQDPLTLGGRSTPTGSPTRDGLRAKHRPSLREERLHES